MIVKSLSRRNNTGQLFQYLFRYILNDEKCTPSSHQNFVYCHNVRARTVAGYIKEFEQLEHNRLYKRIDNIKAYHTILSFSNKDREHIDETVLKNVAKKFVELNGSNKKYVFISHHNKSHVHIHAAISSIQLSGLSSRVSKEKFEAIKIELDRYLVDRHPALVHSLQDHGRAKRLAKEREPVIDRRGGRTSQKQTLVQTLETTFRKSRSIDEFLKALQVQSIKPYYRGTNKRLTGILAGGRKYRLKSLGYPAEKIAELNAAKAKEDKQLKQLSDIRRRSKEREQSREQDNERTLIDRWE